MRVVGLQGQVQQTAQPLQGKALLNINVIPVAVFLSERIQNQLAEEHF